MMTNATNTEIEMMATQQQKVSDQLASTIERMRELLSEEFGSDYAFSILGRGHVIAASDNRAGRVIAQVGEQLPSVYF